MSGSDVERLRALLGEVGNLIDQRDAAEARVAQLEAAARAAVKQHGAAYGECPHDHDALAALERLVERAVRDDVKRYEDDLRDLADG